jgi:hypothetical protein
LAAASSRFVRALIDEGLIDTGVLVKRVQGLPIAEDLRSRLLNWLAERR